MFDPCFAQVGLCPVPSRQVQQGGRGSRDSVLVLGVYEPWVDETGSSHGPWLRRVLGREVRKSNGDKEFSGRGRQRLHEIILP